MTNTNPWEQLKNINYTCTEQVLTEFPELLIGNASDEGITYFDATIYHIKAGLKDYPVEDFFKYYFHPIGALVNMYGLDRENVVVRNQDGHILIDTSLVYLFLSYVRPDFLAFCCDRIDELMLHGFSISDTYLYRHANNRLTPELAKKLYESISGER